MGCWGIEPYENDCAADWFGEFFDKFNILPFIEETLKKKPEYYFEEIRVAAYIIIKLGHNYVWPVDDINRFTILAVERLEAIKKVDEILESREITDKINKEIAILKSRLD
jgi:hypothetical protein